MFAHWEAYKPLLERIKRMSSGVNPFERVPLAILREVKAALEENTLPVWFYASIDIPKLKTAAGVQSPVEDDEEAEEDSEV